MRLGLRYLSEVRQPRMMWPLVLGRAKGEVPVAVTYPPTGCNVVQRFTIGRRSF